MSSAAVCAGRRQGRDARRRRGGEWAVGGGGLDDSFDQRRAPRRGRPRPTKPSWSPSRRLFDEASSKAVADINAKVVGSQDS